MKRVYLIALSVLVGTLAVSSAVAQQTPASSKLRIKKLSGKKERTPQYSTKGASKPSRPQEWFELRAEYDTAPEWVDEVTCTYYALVKPKTGDKKFMLFRGEVSYINVEKGRGHQSVMYLHPNTIARYGDVERIAVVIKVDGQLAGMESYPKNNRRWWEELPPEDGHLLNRLETPFSFVDYDSYEAIKVQAQK